MHERAQTHTNADFRLSEKALKTQANASKRRQTRTNAKSKNYTFLRPEPQFIGVSEPSGPEIAKNAACPQREMGRNLPKKGKNTKMTPNPIFSPSFPHFGPIFQPLLLIFGFRPPGFPFYASQKTPNLKWSFWGVRQKVPEKFPESQKIQHQRCDPESDCPEQRNLKFKKLKRKTVEKWILAPPPIFQPFFPFFPRSGQNPLFGHFFSFRAGPIWGWYRVIRIATPAEGQPRHLM